MSSCLDELINDTNESVRSEALNIIEEFKNLPFYSN